MSALAVSGVSGSGGTWRVSWRGAASWAQPALLRAGLRDDRSALDVNQTSPRRRGQRRGNGEPASARRLDAALP